MIQLLSSLDGRGNRADKTAGCGSVARATGGDTERLQAEILDGGKIQKFLLLGFCIWEVVGRYHTQVLRMGQTKVKRRGTEGRGRRGA